MAFELKDNSGSLFVNNRKEKDSHPDYNGEIKVDGKLYWLSSWKKKDKNGNDYFSLAVKDKAAEYAKAKETVKNTPNELPDDSDIPW